MSAEGELSRQQYEELVDETLMLAANAREDFNCFFEFVMREERTHQPVKLAAHQRVLHKFLVEHDRGVVMMPVGHGKTFSEIAFTLWSIGRNPSLRGAIVSATQEQSEKFVMSVRGYIESSDALHLVFPELQRSTREGDHWTQTRITVERPHGGIHPTLIAIGMDGAIEGARLNWVIVDDLLKADNTRTKDACMKVRQWVQTSVQSRMDPTGEKFIISNTPWHPDDLVNATKARGWATLTMDAEGFVYVQDDVEDQRRALERGEEVVPWDSDELRPAVQTNDPKHPLFSACRLVAHDPDPKGQVTLWPERINRRALEAIRRELETHAFLQSYMCQCRDNDTAWCKTEWIELGKQLAREPTSAIRVHLPNQKPAHGLVAKYQGPYQAFTGVDLAFSEKAKSDDVAFFTFCPLPTGHRLILDIEIGKWNSPTVARKIVQKHRDFGSIITVEDVGAQKGVLQLIRDIATGIPIKGFTTTGSKKASVENGLPAIFSELEQGLWLIPCDPFGTTSPHVTKWIDGLLSYTPSAHTPDALMAMFFARDRARAYGMLGGQQGGKTDLDFSSR